MLGTVISIFKNIFGMDVDKVETNSTVSHTEDDRDVDCSSTNGLMLSISNIPIPEEVIAIVLSFLPWRELLPCRLVCQTWKDIVDSFVCHDKIKTTFGKLVSYNDSSNCFISKLSFGHLPFHVNYIIGTKFGINLLKNPFGNGNTFKPWEILSSGGNGWIVEEVPVGCDPLPEVLEGRSCFATSYTYSYKRQLINLKTLGLNSKIMDEIQPDIKVSEWYAARYDCGSRYQIKVHLLNEKRDKVVEFEDEKRVEQWEGSKWNEVSHTFSNYGPGVRYILFAHGGCDTQYWQGHYGSKMAGGKVVALLPQRMLQRSYDSN